MNRITIAFKTTQEREQFQQIANRLGWKEQDLARKLLNDFVANATPKEEDPDDLDDYFIGDDDKDHQIYP